MTSINNEEILYTVSTIEMRDDMLNFILDYFIPDIPHYAYLNMDRDFFRTFYEPIMPEVCSNGVAIVAIESKSRSIVGVAANSVVQPTDPMQIDTQKFSEVKKKFALLLNKLRCNWLQRIPDCTKMFQIRILCVKPDYRGKQIGKKLVIESLTKGTEYGCNYVTTCAVTTKSQNLFRSLNFHPLNVIKHENYKENDQPIFPNFGDLDHVEWDVKRL